MSPVCGCSILVLCVDRAFVAVVVVAAAVYKFQSPPLTLLCIILLILSPFFPI
jgi:hypothetical protein